MIQSFFFFTLINTDFFKKKKFSVDKYDVNFVTEING